MSAIVLDPPAEGGCLCGAVRYRVEGEVEDTAYCHCRTCQRQSGAPVVAWFAVPPSKLRYTKGAPKKFRASTRAAREFCSDCGTYLLFREDDPAASLGVNTATLDEPARVPPTFHIWHESHIAWFDTTDSFPRFARGKA